MLIKILQKFNEYLTTVLTAFLLLWGIFFIIVYFLNNFIVIDVLGVRTNIEDGEFLVFIASINVLFSLINGIYKSIYDGTQRLDITNLMRMCQVIISAVGTFLVLSTGYGIRGLGYNLIAVSGLFLIINYFVTKKILLGVKLRFGKISSSTIKKLASYSVNFQIASLLRMFVEPINKILLSHFFSVSMVGYYDIALRFSGSISSIIRLV